MKATPAVDEPGAVIEKCVATAVVTVMAPLVPVIDGVTVSVPVIVCVPAVASVALKVPTPFVKVASAGSDAPGSELVKWTIPE